MKLTIKDMNDYVKGLVPNAREIEVENSDSGKRLNIETISWTMEPNPGDKYYTPKLVIMVKQ